MHIQNHACSLNQLFPPFCARPVKVLPTNTQPVSCSLYSYFLLSILYFCLGFQQRQRSACFISTITRLRKHFDRPKLDKLCFCISCYCPQLQFFYLFISYYVSRRARRIATKIFRSYRIDFATWSQFCPTEPAPHCGKIYQKLVQSQMSRLFRASDVMHVLGSGYRFVDC